MKSLWCIVIAFLLLGGAIAVYACVSPPPPPPSTVNVTTYHNDNLRTGWNSNETLLTATSFPAAFALQHSVVVDDQIDAEPLYLNNVFISGAPHNVVYTVTENNTVYSIDADTGNVLNSRNFGAPRATPLGCTNNGPNVGINSTPVIDTSTSPPTMYVVAYLGATPSYQIHAIDVTTLADVVAPVTITASHTLTDSTQYTFNASTARQRVALLLQDGNVYVAFTSFCDDSPGSTRGWIIGYKVNTLAPLAANELTDTQNTGGYYMATIWMSGYGLAGVPGTIFFTTGNGGSGTYNGTTSVQESALSLNSTTFAINHIFTEPNPGTLDTADNDFGAGGMMLLPDAAGTSPHLAVAGGKDGILYLLNRDTLAQITTVTGLGGCWCGESYFMGSDGLPRVVTSFGTVLKTRKVTTTTIPLEFNVTITTGIQAGFFTAVSSNGTTAGSQIIWAVAKEDPLVLYAFNSSLTQLFSANAGAWSFGFVGSGASPNTVPLVANGRVYVGAYKVLSIFGVN
jgi:hypothetical protein